MAKIRYCYRSLLYKAVVATVLLLCVACGSNTNKRVFAQVDKLASEGMYSEAYKLLDSIEALRLADLQLRKQILHKRKDIKRCYNEQRLTVIPLQLDSLTQVKQKLTQALFYNTSSAEYGSSAFVSSQQRLKGITPVNPVKLLARCDTLGFTSLEVISLSATPLTFSRVAFVTPDTIVITSGDIVFDGDFYYKAKVGNNYYQAVTLSPNNSEQLLALIRVVPTSAPLVLRLYSQSGHVVYEKPFPHDLQSQFEQLAQLSVCLQMYHKLLVEQHNRRKFLKSNAISDNNTSDMGKYAGLPPHLFSVQYQKNLFQPL